MKLNSTRAVDFCLVGVLMCVAPVALHAQETFSINGSVKTEKGRAFPKAVVTADNKMGLTVAVFSRPDGGFAITGLLPGSYEVSAEQSGYVKVSETIVIPTRKSLSLVLKLAPPTRHTTENKIHEAMLQDF